MSPIGSFFFHIAPIHSPKETLHRARNFLIRLRIRESPYRETSDSNNRRHERGFCDVFKVCDLHSVEFVGRYRASFKQSLDELSRGCSFLIWPMEYVLWHVSGIFGAVYARPFRLC